MRLLDRGARRPVPTPRRAVGGRKRAGTSVLTRLPLASRLPEIQPQGSTPGTPAPIGVRRGLAAASARSTGSSAAPRLLPELLVDHLDDELRKRIADALRNALSPRHAPDAVVAVPAIPRTLTGKKLEVPVKRILLGAEPDKVASRDTLANPHALDELVALVRGRGEAPRRVP